MSILKIKNERGEWQGITSVKGEKGDPGVSPDIVVSKNDRKTYQLTIDTKDRTFTTPNLRADSSAQIGNTDGELGMIDNWFEPEGHRVTPYLSELPELPRLGAQYPTRYKFDHDVTMYVLDGEPNENGIVSIEDYKKYEGDEIVVQPNGQEALRDYIIYNARPKYEWDTWEERQLMNKVLGFPNAAANFDQSANGYHNGARLYNAGDWNWVNLYMVATRDAGAALCDEDLKYYRKKQNLEDPSIEEWDSTDPGMPMPYTDVYDVENDCAEKANWQSSTLGHYITYTPQMKTGIWNQTEGFVSGNCCGNFDQWGITHIIKDAVNEDDAREQFPREMGMTIFNEGHIEQNTDLFGFNALKDADKHRGIFVALDPNKNYTIESLNGQVGIYAPYSNINMTNATGTTPGFNHGKHVTKVRKALHQSYLETISVYRREESQIVGDGGPTITGKVAVGSDKVLATSVSYFVNEDPDIYGVADVPSIFNTPHKVLDKGQSMTFNIGKYFYEYVGYTPQAMWGIYLFCWNEEDYNGIKIVEGIEPYSTINSERLATGATKFNLKVYFGEANDNHLANVELPRYEYNIKLVDTTEDNGYVRYLTNEMKKSYDLDEFSLEGHHHALEDIEGMDAITSTIPTMQLSTVSLSDGVSSLPENTFYFVYEE